MAKSTDWGLTDAGFRRPTYAELLDALEYKARELFGPKANLTVRSPLGIFLRIFVWMLNLLFSTLEDVYNSRFIDTAVGASLYNLGRALGLRLLGAQKAVGYLTFTGENGVEVPEGFLAETTAGMQYVRQFRRDTGWRGNTARYGGFFWPGQQYGRGDHHHHY